MINVAGQFLRLTQVLFRELIAVRAVNDMAIEFKARDVKTLTGIFIDVNKISSTNETLEKSYDFNNLEQILFKMKELQEK